MKFMWNIFGIALILSLASSLLVHSSLILPHILGSPSTVAWIFFLKGVLTFLVSPVLVFGVFYLLGRGVNLTAEFMSVVVPLFLGFWLGNVTGYLSMFFISFLVFGGAVVGFWFLTFLWYIFTAAFSINLFAGFTALSIACLTKETP